jgi:hypothetical protein
LDRLGDRIGVYIQVDHRRCRRKRNVYIRYCGQGIYRSSRAYGWRSRQEWLSTPFCLRGSRNGGLSKDTALFSFEGTALAASSTLRRSTRREATSPKPSPIFKCWRREIAGGSREASFRSVQMYVRERATKRAAARSFFENCIEKNFHVS